MADLKDIFASPRLPTLPTVAVRLIDLRKDPESGIKDIVEVVKYDSAICARLMKLANSTYCALRNPVTTVDRAVQLLGGTVVTSVALSFYLSEATTGKGPLAEHYSSYWLQSIVQATAADILSSRESGKSNGEAFLAGLLMDLGRLAMLSTIPDEYLPVLEAQRARREPLCKVEIDSLGYDHVEVGTELIKRWNFAESFSRALLFHHAPAEFFVENKDEKEPLISTLAIAAAVGDYFCSAEQGKALARIRELSDVCFGLNEADVTQLIEQTREKVDEDGEFFSADTNKIPPLIEIYADATEQLAALVVRENVAQTHATGRLQMIEEANVQLTQEAFHDPLTKIYNRRFLEELLDKEVSRNCRTADPIGVIFSDIDHFKRINDVYGHQAGDCVLASIAGLFQRLVRDSDTLARYGGEEFIILVSQPTEKGIYVLAERLRAEVESAEFVFDNQRINVTISVGASIAIPGRTEIDIHEKLVAAADAAMYDSKQNGRNQVHVSSLINDSERQLARRVTTKRFSHWLVQRGDINIAAASRAMREFDPPHVRLGELATRLGYLDMGQVEHVLLQQESSGERFGAMAMRLGLLSKDQLVFLMVLQQEDPAEFSKCLVRLNIVGPDDGVRLLSEYLLDSDMPQPAVSLDA